MYEESERRVNVKIGDKVQYSRQWLQSTGTYTGDIPFARGTVVMLHSIGERTIATIDWKDDNIPRKVMTCNLILVGAIEHV